LISGPLIYDQAGAAGRSTERRFVWVFQIGLFEKRGAERGESALPDGSGSFSENGFSDSNCILDIQGMNVVTVDFGLAAPFRQMFLRTEEIHVVST
jgi:hypothetical protein